MDSPVVLIIFRRPDLTEQVLQCLARAKPPKLFVVADGPRGDHPDDIERVRATRALIDKIDWDCEVYRNFSETNLGCGLRPASGISWAFEHVDRAVILEDDCVPDDSFFPFCDELLERYNDDERIMQISGNNFQFGNRRGADSYYFSKFGICWGWATWRRAWQHFDLGVKGWEELRGRKWLAGHLGSEETAAIFQRLFEEAYNASETVDYWDFQWTFACWVQNGLAITPNSTLVTNLGCRPDGTHTKTSKRRTAQLPTEPIEFPLRHPRFIFPDYEADQFLADNLVRVSRKRRPMIIHQLRSLASGWVPERLKRILRPPRLRSAR